MSLFTITKKQVNVIWGAWKRGEVQVEKGRIDMMYRMVENQGRDGSYTDRMNRAIRGAIDAIFKGDLEKAQECIDAFAEADDAAKREQEQIKADKARFAAMREQAIA